MNNFLRLSTPSANQHQIIFNGQVSNQSGADKTYMMGQNSQKYTSYENTNKSFNNGSNPMNSQKKNQSKQSIEIYGVPKRNEKQKALNNFVMIQQLNKQKGGLISSTTLPVNNKITQSNNFVSNTPKRNQFLPTSTKNAQDFNNFDQISNSKSSTKKQREYKKYLNPTNAQDQKIAKLLKQETLSYKQSNPYNPNSKQLRTKEKNKNIDYQENQKYSTTNNYTHNFSANFSVDLSNLNYIQSNKKEAQYFKDTNSVHSAKKTHYLEGLAVQKTNQKEFSQSPRHKKTQSNVNGTNLIKTFDFSDSHKDNVSYDRSYNLNSAFDKSRQKNNLYNEKQFISKNFDQNSSFKKKVGSQFQTFIPQVIEYQFGTNHTLVDKFDKMSQKMGQKQKNYPKISNTSSINLNLIDIETNISKIKNFSKDSELSSDLSYEKSYSLQNSPLKNHNNKSQDYEYEFRKFDNLVQLNLIKGSSKNYFDDQKFSNNKISNEKKGQLRSTIGVMQSAKDMLDFSPGIRKNSKQLTPNKYQSFNKYNYEEDVSKHNIIKKQPIVVPFILQSNKRFSTKQYQEIYKTLNQKPQKPSQNESKYQPAPISQKQKFQLPKNFNQNMDNNKIHHANRSLSSPSLQQHFNNFVDKTLINNRDRDDSYLKIQPKNDFKPKKLIDSPPQKDSKFNPVFQYNSYSPFIKNKNSIPQPNNQQYQIVNKPQKKQSPLKKMMNQPFISDKKIEHPSDQFKKYSQKTSGKPYQYEEHEKQIANILSHSSNQKNNQTNSSSNILQNNQKKQNLSQKQQINESPQKKKYQLPHPSKKTLGQIYKETQENYFALDTKKSIIIPNNTLNNSSSGSLFYDKIFKINDFQLGKVVGSGQYGDVIISRHKNTRYLLTIKKVLKGTIKEMNIVQQFISEIKIHSKLNHENIIRLYNFFDDEYHIFLLMEFAQEGTLQTYSKSSAFKSLNGVKKQQKISKILYQLLSALNYLHRMGIIHRDIKLQNILMTHGDNLKLCDFGYSTDLNSGMKKTFCGTLDYIAPQIMQKNLDKNGVGYDQSVDLWATGVLAYELFVGKAPYFDQYSKIQKMKAVKKKKSSFKSQIQQWSQMFKKVQVIYPQDIGQNAKNFIKGLLTSNPSHRMTVYQAISHPFITKYNKKQ